ncbi:hypothetical protein CEXT_186671 [Caerostris extrusa]|uniref:Uncharacterized protein n=1 Tax=Caerostris extrusa TaxID=172846 RepID=A0AAV4YDV7_CAEEX|nr:hypothetical protein CEXT_186671 [Caerostris extrusa]
MAKDRFRRVILHFGKSSQIVCDSTEHVMELDIKGNEKEIVCRVSQRVNAAAWACVEDNDLCHLRITESKSKCIISEECLIFLGV